MQDSTFVTHVAAGKHHFAACTTESSNNLWTWGLNDKGQLGLGDTLTREYPTQVQLPRTVKYVECGEKVRKKGEEGRRKEEEGKEVLLLFACSLLFCFLLTSKSWLCSIQHSLLLKNKIKQKKEQQHSRCRQ